MPGGENMFTWGKFPFGLIYFYFFLIQRLTQNMKISAPHLRVEWFGTLGSRRDSGHITCMQDSNTEQEDEAVLEL